MAGTEAGRRSRPSRAEVARTLVHGRLPGTLQLPDPPTTSQVAHATDSSGRPLILLRDGDTLDAVLPCHRAGHGPPVVLSVADVPPVDGAPGRGRVRIYGRPRRLTAAAAALAVHEFAGVNPAADLLDVGRGASLCLVDVDRVRLDQHLASLDIDLTSYATAEPDPLHPIERDLLTDLADHHSPQIDSYLRCLLAITGRPCAAAPRAVRLDRYGFVVDIGHRDGDPGDRWVRLSFPQPVRCRHELAHLLHPVLFPACAHPPGTH